MYLSVRGGTEEEREKGEGWAAQRDFERECGGIWA